MKNRKFNKIRIAVLKSVTALNLISLLICICLIESFETWQPFAVMICNAAWLMLMAWANDLFDYEEDQDVVWVEVRPTSYDNRKAYAWKRRDRNCG